MIYQLPSRGQRRYRGKYPTRVRSYSLSRVAHLELNNGKRYVCFMRDLDGSRPVYGRSSEELFGDAEINVMRLADYAGIVFITRLIRVLLSLKVMKPRAVRRLSSSYLYLTTGSLLRDE